MRLNGPYSNKALLGTGWAQAALGEYREALGPWMELRDRNLLDAAVQESYLAVPYAFGKLDAAAQSAEYYEQAVTSFDAEGVQLDEAIDRIRSGNMLDTLLGDDQDTHYGWFWQLRDAAGCAGVALSVHRARRARFPGRPQELSRPRLSRATRSIAGPTAWKPSAT